MRLTSLDAESAAIVVGKAKAIEAWALDISPVEFR